MFACPDDQFNEGNAQNSLTLWSVSVKLCENSRLVDGNGAVDLKFVPCPIVSKFMSYNNNFFKLNTIIINARNRVNTARRASVPWYI